MKITLLTGQICDFSDVLGIKIKVVRRLRSKNISLRIDEKLRMPVLSVPGFCSAKKARNFVLEHKDWIVNSLAKIPSKITLKDKDVISLGGKNIEIFHDKLRRGTNLEKEVLAVGGDESFLHRRVMDFAKKYASALLSEKTYKIAKKIDCKVHKITLKDTKSRWGSCSSKNNINYNWRIIFAPEYVIDYLVCHEVSHLKYRDHSSDFWLHVKSLCPDYETGRHWLKIRGKELFKY